MYNFFFFTSEGGLGSSSHTKVELPVYSIIVNFFFRYNKILKIFLKLMSFSPLQKNGSEAAFLKRGHRA